MFTKEFVMKSVNFFIVRLSGEDRDKFSRLFTAIDGNYTEYKPVFEFIIFKLYQCLAGTNSVLQYTK